MQISIRQLGIEHIAAYSPEARGRSERAFQTHQGRLPQELERAGITDMGSANRYLEQVYRHSHNREFCVASTLPGTAYVPFISGSLPDILCEQYERTVGNDNCVAFEGLSLQLPADELRYHYVRARVRVHRYVDDTLGVFHGPRKLAGYDAKGRPPQGEQGDATSGRLRPARANPRAMCRQGRLQIDTSCVRLRALTHILRCLTSLSLLWSANHPVRRFGYLSIRVIYWRVI